MQQRISTIEEYQKQINIIMEYINNHLDQAVDLTKLAEISHFSPYHFHRITRAFMGEPIGTYIIRVRLETAARLIRYTDMSVAEIAYRVGYDVPASLSKAFKQQYGISPSEYRTNKDFTIMKAEKKDMQLKIKAPKIVEIEAKQAIYIKLTGKYGSLDFSGSWQRLWQFVKEHKLFTAGMEHIAIYHDDPKVTESDKLRTDICLVVKKDVKAQGNIGVKEIKAGKFAVFHYQGSYSNLDAVYDTIYARLLPENNLKLRDYHCFEKYLNHPDRTEAEKLKTEIYIPVE
ncbi:AraC family transcriptional regulator [Bacteroidales bacterium OttesenSCG-928-M06]|nr:AraC family transcriptional regulator [Bacteroidales bacterium OttesenSCG-928-M06]